MPMESLSCLDLNGFDFNSTKAEVNSLLRFEIDGVVVVDVTGVASNESSLGSR